MMGEPKLSESALEFVKNCFNSLYVNIKRHALWFTGSAVVVLACWQIWLTYDQLRRRDLTFLIGGSSGTNVVEARRIRDEVEKDSGLLIGTYHGLKLEPTSGYEENRRLIQQDDDGTVVGFAYDGFGDPENVAIVLPLDKRYLHILCTKRFLAEVRRKKRFGDSLGEGIFRHFLNFNQPDLASELTSEDIFRALGRGRAYLGTFESATRQCAEIVLKHFRVKPDEVRCYGVSGFDEMRAALAAGHIDMAFSSGGFNLDEIRAIAQDGTCELLGLNDDRDAIVQENPHLLSVDFQANSYTTGGFCPTVRKTIGARRVLICSDAMSTEDAYLVGVSTYRALRNIMPEIEWETPPPGAERTRSAPLRYQLHEGAQLIRDNRMPTTEVHWLQMSYATVAVWVLAEILRAMNRLFHRGSTVSSGPQPSSETAMPERGGVDDGPREDKDDFAKMKGELETHIHELERESLKLSKKSRAKWAQTIDDFQQRILTAREAGVLNSKEARVLLTGLNRELKFEYDIRRPKTPTRR